MQIGRLHTLFTSNLSHYDPLHFTINMVVLYNVGNEVIQIINPSRYRDPLICPARLPESGFRSLKIVACCVTIRFVDHGFSYSFSL